MNNIDLAQLDSITHYGFLPGSEEPSGYVLRSELDEVLAPRSLTSGSPAEPKLARQAVASVVSRVGNNLRVGWLRPERCEVGTLLYTAVELVAAPVHGAAAPSAAQALADMEARKDAAYYERNQVVAALAKCFPSGVARTAIEGWSEDWHGCVYIDLPTGQVSWHFHDSQAHLFADLPPYAGKWDGHDTPEKYRRVGALEVSAGAAAKTDHAECWSDAVPCNKCGAVGWHDCRPSASAAGAGSAQPAALDGLVGYMRVLENGTKMGISFDKVEEPLIEGWRQVPVFARAALTQQAGAAAPSREDAAEGWKLVPVEPTSEMRKACRDAYHKTDATYDSLCRAIVNAAPLPAHPAQGGDKDAISDRRIIELMYPRMLKADGGYACDTFPEHVVAGVRAVLSAAHPGQDGEKDAQRYRCWRNAVVTESEDFHIITMAHLPASDSPPTVEQVDAAVDAAMAAAQQDAK